MEVSPQNITSLDGKDVTLKCQALGAPLPNVTWIFDGKSHSPTSFSCITATINNSADSVIIESSSRFQIFADGDLVISNLQEKDAGSYKCIRSNEAGSVSGEAFLGVLGEYNKYRFRWMTDFTPFCLPVRTHITQPPVDTTVLLGLTATLQCKVSSDQNVNYTIQWYRNEQ